VQREEKEIWMNGKLFAKAVTEYSARWMAAEVSRLQKCAEKKRAAEIEKTIAASCDPVEVTRRVKEFQMQSWALKYLSNWLFVFLFGACPILVWRLGMVGAIWPMVIGIYLQTIVIALVFSKVHRKLYASDSGQIFKPFLTMLLAAPSAIRAHDILGRPLLESFHPVAVAKALCRSQDFESFASAPIRDLLFPRMPVVPPDSPEAAIAVEKDFREMVLKSLKRKLAFDETEFLKAPEKTETVHTAYCPRCLQQFTEAATSCPDCGGRPLVKF
jgi:hypothetical protein